MSGSVIHLILKAFPAKLDGTYPEVTGFAVAYEGNVFFAASFESLLLDTRYSLPHGFSMDVYLQKGIRCVRFLRLKGRRQLRLGAAFSFANLYSDGTVRSSCGQIDTNAIEQYMARCELSESSIADDVVDGSGSRRCRRESREVSKSRGRLCSTENSESVIEQPNYSETYSPVTKGLNEMSSEVLSRPVKILISKLETDSEVAQHAAEALIDQAHRHGEKLAGAIPLLTPFLYSGSYNLRAAISRVLGYIGTHDAVKALSHAFLTIGADELATLCGFSCWAEQPLSYWFADAIGENKTKKNARTLLALLTSDKLSDAAKAGVMLQLGYFDFSDLSIRLTDEHMSLLERFASSDEPQISEGAIKMLGQV